MKKYPTIIISYIYTKIKESEYTYLSLIAFIVGVLAGVGAIIFRYMIELFQWIFFGHGEHLYHLIKDAPLYHKIIIPAVGGAIVGSIAYFYERGANGHGVPEIMSAVALRGGVIKKKIVAVSTLLSAISIGTASSVGSEGPIVQLGAGIGSGVGQALNLSGSKMKSLVACGTAGGIAAIFNAPLAGVMFAVEIIIGDLAFSTFGPLVISAVTATVISRSWWGDIPVMNVPKYEMVSTWEIPAYILLGIIAALVAFLFTKFLYKTEDFFDEKVKVPGYIKPAIGGLLVGLLGLLSPHIYGVGYYTIDLALIGNLPLSLLFSLIFIKIIATSISLGSGSSGGEFAPTLFIGAVLGGAFGKVAHGIFPAISASSGAYAVLGMGGVLAGATYAPITAIMLIFEMTSDYKLIIPLMLTCITSAIFASHLSKESIYTLKLARAGINLKEGKEVNILKSILVKDARTRTIKTIPENMTIRGLNEYISDRKSVV